MFVQAIEYISVPLVIQYRNDWLVDQSQRVRSVPSGLSVFRCSSSFLSILFRLLRSLILFLLFSSSSSSSSSLSLSLLLTFTLHLLLSPFILSHLPLHPPLFSLLPFFFLFLLPPLSPLHLCLPARRNPSEFQPSRPPLISANRPPSPPDPVAS